MNTFTICRKELSTYFRSPIAYGVMAFYALIAGFFFWFAVYSVVRSNMMAMLQGQSIPMDATGDVIRYTLSNISVWGLIVLPAITMRLFAEEKKSGTYELLITSPLRDFEIILGKWLASMVLYLAMLATVLISTLLLFAYGKPDWRPMAIAYIGLICQAAVFLAIGTFVSACTRNQVVAFVATEGICLLVWIINWFSSLDSSVLFRVISYISVTQHYDSFSKGVIDLKDAVYFVSMVVLGLFLTGRAMESIRWRA